MLRKIFLVVLVATFLPFNAPQLFAAMSSAHYQIWADGFSSGGDNSSSTNFQLEDTIQSNGNGAISSTNFSNSGSGLSSQQYFQGQEVLTLSVGSGNLAFGQLSPSLASTVSTTLTVSSNSYYGVNVTYSGNTLNCPTCGGGTIPAIGATAASSAIGSSQFGFNVIDTGSAASPKASATANYSNPSKYAFHSGDQIVSSSRDINPTTFNLNFLANMSGVEAQGNYSTSLTFTALANF